MLKLITLVFLIVLQFFGAVEPAFARAPGVSNIDNRPIYKRQVEYIIENSCKAIGMVPYNGITYYSCPSGEKFWAEVLVPVPDSPLFMYFKNRKHQDDDDAAASIQYD
jgi:hypothetical protein